MHVRRGVLPFDLVGFSSDQHRQHVAPSEDCVHLYLATVQSAMPACLCSIEFEAVAFTVDGNVVDHKKLASRVDTSDATTPPAVEDAQDRTPQPNPSILAARFQPDAATPSTAPFPELGDKFPWPATVEVGSSIANIPAAMAATSASSRRIGAGCDFN